MSRKRKIRNVEIKELKKDDDFKAYSVYFDNKPGIVYIGCSESLVKRMGIAAGIEAALHKIGLKMRANEAKNVDLYWEKYYIIPNLEDVAFRDREYDKMITSLSGSLVPYATPKIPLGYGSEVRHGEASGVACQSDGSISVYSEIKDFQVDICPVCGEILSPATEFCTKGHKIQRGLRLPSGYLPSRN